MDIEAYTVESSDYMQGHRIRKMSSSEVGMGRHQILQREL